MDTWLLNQFESGADVLTFNPNPDSPDYNQLLSNGYIADCGPDGGYGRGGRPFYLLYEHVNGAGFEQEKDGRIDMNLATNRQKFEEHLDFMFWNVIWPCQARYVTWNQEALVFLWSMGDMKGDVASLLERLGAKYPVAFVGGVNVLHFPDLHGPEEMRSLRALDIIMEYTLFPVVPTLEEEAAGRILYARMVKMHTRGNLLLGIQVKKWEQEKNGRKRLLVPTMPFAFDDANWRPKRANLPMYPESREEVERFAQRIYEGMRNGTYAPLVGPFAIWDEHFEGGAVTPSLCTPETLDRPGRWVGCGYARSEMMRQFFGRRR
ncbi:MAG: hypothetical protein WAX80_01735 [Minisyncoccia bacterium]